MLNSLENVAFILTRVVFSKAWVLRYFSAADVSTRGIMVSCQLITNERNYSLFIVMAEKSFRKY